MLMLFHHPLCAHSRFVRLALGEFGADVELVEERVHERRPDFLMLNAAGTTPVLVEHPETVVVGPGPVAEYLDETRGLALGQARLMPEGPAERAEVRRLMDWFNSKFHAEVTDWLVREKVTRRFLGPREGGGGPDMDVVRSARANIRSHLAYIGWLAGTRNWLAGDQMSYADLAAAAQLSCADYLGDVPWAENENAKNWYARIKSRPSFRALLADRIAGMKPDPIYADLGF